jgi:NAD(P)-dependent dehydrogenase (short-subunit alcohol dehydrogenase family)
MSVYPELKNKVVVITGAAGALAEAVIARFLAEESRLALVDRERNRLETKYPDLDRGRVLFTSADITNKELVTEAVHEIATHFGGIAVLINLAGGYRSGTPVHETDEETWDFMLNLNAKSVFLVSGAVVPVMLQGKQGGRIINVGASGGLKGGKNSAAYSVSKSAVFRLTESMSAELKNDGIMVNAVYPSTIDTPANRASMPNADFGKWVTAESLADVIAFLASDAARDITGASIPVLGRGSG